MAYSKLAKGSKRIVVLAGKTFRGVIHYQEAAYDVSENYADMVIENGDAVLHECQK